MAVDSDDLSAILSSTALILLGVALTSVSKLLERVVVARAFSPDVYGEVSMALAVLTIGTTVSLVGFNQGIPRYVSRFDDERDVRGAWLTGLLITGAVSVVVAAAIYLNADRLAGYLFEGETSAALLRVFALVVPINVGVIVGVSTLRGLENTRYKTYANDLLLPGLRLALLAGLLAAGASILAVGYAYAVAAVATLVAAHYLSNRLVDLVGPVRFHARDLLAFSAPLIVSALLALLLTRIDTLMVGYFRPSSEVGLYSAAFPLANSLLMVVSAFGYLYLPLTSRLDADGKRDEVGGVYRITTKWAFVVTFPAFLLFVAFPADVLTIFFGAEYAAGGIALAILAVGFFTSASVGRNRATLSALGETNYILVADLTTIAANLALNLVLIPRFGFVGAATASAAAYALRNAIISGILYLRFDIAPLTGRTAPTYAAVPLALVPPGVALSELVSLSMVTLPLFLVGTGLATLVVVALTGGLQAEDAAVVTFLEETIGVELSFVRRYIPAAAGESATGR